MSIRHEWYQTTSHVVVTVFAKNVDPQNANIQFGERHLDVSIKLSEDREFGLDLDLCDFIAPNESTVNFLSTKVEIKLKKRADLRWTSLEKTQSDFATIRFDDATNVEKNLYPSSKGKKNWDKLATDLVGEEKPEGEEALNQLFQQIYSNGTDEQKRAMMKSFTESNGTVLSTNWDDVGKRNVEG
eukprot:TRINITY_DN581_c0_g1_i1.p1 TRINITY_DN581_c0_g1~~TRINITY_DN581_c0_g1_i1.p1  ORF type:complete len:185 (-),score=81.73 TRINITY_DN581_c0_g1_i1:299-853(-)